MSAVIISRKIVRAQVVKGDAAAAGSTPFVYQRVHEKLVRPEVLEGYTYKLKSPLTKNGSLYITINHIRLNHGTDQEQVWPWEIFLNGKDADSYQWVVALMLVISAVFRKGGDVTFIVDELKSVFDPNGGYLSKNGYVPSLVAEIGSCIEEDFIKIGLLKPDVTHLAVLAEKKEEFLKAGGSMDNAGTCVKCKSKAVVIVGGCGVCTQCGDSSCS